MDLEVNNSVVEEFKKLNNESIEFTKKCSSLAHDIQSGSCTLVQLVEQLKDLLVDTSPQNRELGMLILSQVLELLPRDHLVAAQLNFICAFYADRLNDHHQVIPAVLKGILALLKFNNIPEGATRQILGSLFQNVPCQQQQQADRRTIYKILEVCFEKRYAELEQMGFDLIYGVISAMDGERDPRNLLFLFNWLPRFLERVALGHLTEEMFEVMSCYFPVDFRAPLQDPNSISREDLASALCRCLCALPDFAEYCLPVALEKLSSTLRVAKLDSLEIIAKGCKTFALSAYIQHSTDIWSQIQREIFNRSDEELGEVAVNTLEVVINKLSQGTDEILNRILSDITDTLKGNLFPHMKLFGPSCKMLYHVAKASKISASYMISEIVPLLINTYNLTMTVSHQVLLLRRTIDLVRAYTEMHGEDNDKIKLVMEELGLSNLCRKAVLHENDEMRSTGLMSLAMLAGSVPNNDRMWLYGEFPHMLMTSSSKLVRDSLLHCFKAFAETHTEEIEKYVLQEVFEVENKLVLSLYLDSLGAIVANQAFTAVVLQIYIKFCLTNDDYAAVAINCLKNLLQNQVTPQHSVFQHFLVTNENIVEKLTEVALNLNMENLDVLSDISAIFKLVIAPQNNVTQFNIVSSKLQDVVNLYKYGRRNELILIFDGLLTCLRKEVNVEFNLLDDLLAAALNPDMHKYIQQIAVCLLANILNKSSDVAELDKYLNTITDKCSDILNNSSNKEEHVAAISVISWTTKSLVMRGHQNAESFTNKLIELLETHEDVAKGFQIIMNDDCPSLSSTSYCNRRLLYQQKFFLEVSNKLSENYKEGNVNYLLAIGYLLQEAPKQAFILQFNKILRLVVLCLEQCQDADVLCAVLETLCSLILNKEPLIEEHIQEFLPRFLKLSTFESSMQVRVKALMCVRHYPKGLPLYKLLPLRQDVIHSLSQCLDDKKRLVRKEAVECRLCWFMLDAPT